MSTAADIISLWPSAEHFAADIGCKYRSYGRVLKMRGRIPSHYWSAALEAAVRRNIPLTLGQLQAAHTSAAPSHEPAGEAA